MVLEIMKWVCDEFGYGSLDHRVSRESKSMVLERGCVCGFFSERKCVCGVCVL